MTMKIAFIGSVPDIEEVHALGTIEMALVHLFEKPKYAEYFRKQITHGREVILDNSIMELGSAVAGTKCLEVAEEFAPSFVVAPDSFNDRKGTIAATTDFLRLKSKKARTRILQTIGVAHGKNWKDWCDCFINHQLNGSIDMIGIPYGTTFEVPGLAYRNKDSKTLVMMDNRLAMTAWIAQNVRKPKPCHLLGASEPRELFWQKKHKFIYSHDSSSAYTTGYNAFVLGPSTGLGGREKFKMDFDLKAGPDAMATIKENAATILSWVK